MTPTELLARARRREVLATTLAAAAAAIGLLLLGWSMIDWLVLVLFEAAVLVCLACWRGYRLDTHRFDGGAPVAMWLLMLTGLLLLVFGLGSVMAAVFATAASASDGSGTGHSELAHVASGAAGSATIATSAGEARAAIDPGGLLAEGVRSVLGSPWGWCALAAAATAQVMHAKPLAPGYRWDGLGTVVVRVLALQATLAVGYLLMWMTGSTTWLALVFLPIKLWIELTLLWPKSTADVRVTGHRAGAGTRRR